MKVLIADYGLNMWYGDNYDYEDRLTMLKELGYDGLERLHAATEAKAVANQALANKLGMYFATVETGRADDNITWSSALGKKYIWVKNNARDFDTFCRQINTQTEVAAKYGVKVALHNHLGSLVETQAQLTEFMERCPDTGLILDIGHLAGADGDPLVAIDKYFERIVMVHLKDFVYLNREETNWQKRLCFCELGTGVMGELTGRVLEKLIAKGYDSWLAVEHDTHLRDPKIDLKNSRDYIRRFGI